MLYAIAKDGEARQVTSSAFIKRHRLASASAVQSAIKKLLDKDFITEINKTYSLTDRLFALWIKKRFTEPVSGYKQNIPLHRCTPNKKHGFCPKAG